MVQVTRSFAVDKPPDVVVAYLSDFGHAEEWDPGTRSCTRVEEGPITPGARWHNVSQFRGRETELDYRLVDLCPDRVLLRGVNKTVTSTDDIRVTPEGTGSRILYRATLDFHGLAKLAGPFLKRGFERVADDTEEQLTRVIGQLSG